MSNINYNLLADDKLEYVEIAEETELPNGERLFVEIDDHAIVVFNIAGKLFAIEDVCSHDNAPLGDGELENEYEISCPRHGARFDVRDGSVKRPPASGDIPAYPVRVVAGMIELGLPVE